MNNTTNGLTDVKQTEVSINQTVSTACGFISLLVFLCSSVLSTSVLWALWKTNQIQCPVYRIVAFLLMDEVLVRILGSPMIVSSLLAGQWLYGEFGCIFYGFWMTWMGVTATSLFTCVSVERYIIVCRPEIKRLLTKKFVDMMGLVCYLHGLVWGSVPLVGVTRYVSEPSGISCTPDWSHDNLGFMLGLFSVCFLMPVIVSLFCYTAIFRKLRIQQRERVILRHESAVERHIAVTVFVTMGAFLFAWTPYSVIGLNTTLGFRNRMEVSKELSLIPLITAKTAGLWNPIIFSFRNKEVSEALRGKFNSIKEVLRFQVVCRRTNQILPEAANQTKSSISYDRSEPGTTRVTMFQVSSK